MSAHIDWLAIASKHGYAFPDARMAAFVADILALSAQAAAPVDLHVATLDIEFERAEFKRSRNGRHRLHHIMFDVWIEAKRAALAHPVDDRAAELIAAFESMMQGCRDQSWAEYQNGDGENVGKRIEAARKAYYGAHPVAVDAPTEDVIEGLEILDSLIDNIEEHGNYSKESTLTFLRQIKQCFPDVAAIAGQDKEGS